MPRNALREHLRQLHHELSQAEELDPEARALLAEVSEEIERLLGEEEPGPGEALAERLREAAERFEQSHPALTAVVGRLANALANLGI